MRIDAARAAIRDIRPVMSPSAASAPLGSRARRGYPASRSVAMLATRARFGRAAKNSGSLAAIPRFVGNNTPAKPVVDPTSSIPDLRIEPGRSRVAHITRRTTGIANRAKRIVGVLVRAAAVSVRVWMASCGHSNLRAEPSLRLARRAASMRSATSSSRSAYRWP